MMIPVDISPFALEMIGGEKLADVAHELIEREALRLWHIKRSQPGNATTAIGKSLVTMFNRKRRLLGGELTPTLEVELERVMEAIQRNNHAELEALWHEAPWTKK
jgi:hypothetical protein